MKSSLSFGLSLALAARICATDLFAQDEQAGLKRAEAPIKGLRVPLEHYQNGKIKTQLTAERATVHEEEGNIQGSNVKFLFYDESGNINAVIACEDCRYDKREKTASSKSNVRLEKEDMVITGAGFEWRADECLVKIFENVKVVFNRSIGGTHHLLPASPGRGDAKPGDG